MINRHGDSGVRVESVRTVSESNSGDWGDGAGVCSPRTNHPGVPIDFRIEGSGNNYSHLNKSKWKVKLTLTTATDGEIATATKVGTLNLPLHSLFKSVTTKIVNKVVRESKNLYPYRYLLETLLNPEREMKKSRHTCEG